MYIIVFGLKLVCLINLFLPSFLLKENLNTKTELIA